MLVSASALSSPEPRPLDRFIERIEVKTPRPGELRRSVDMLPDGTTSLVFRALGAGAGDISVRGPLMRAHYKTAPAIPLSVRVVFRPGGAYPFFGVPVSDLTDRMVPLEDLWGSSAQALMDDLLSMAEANGDVGAAVERALLDRIRSRPFEPASAVQARVGVRLLGKGDLSMNEVAYELGISSRHLRRAFHATVGFGPKTYARIARFQRALTLGRTRPGRWGEVARATGYFDQAHLTADFRELALVSPGAVDREVPRVRHAC
jgi:AraC-like DNA-binding protein